ncbi:hypothetical protein AK812_SmicGene20304, partial [Symbiodinium microadriaticum]
ASEEETRAGMAPWGNFSFDPGHLQRPPSDPPREASVRFAVQFAGHADSPDEEEDGDQENAEELRRQEEEERARIAAAAQELEEKRRRLAANLATPSSEEWAECVAYLPESAGKALMKSFGQRVDRKFVPSAKLREVLKTSYPARDLTEMESSVSDLQLAGTNIMMAAIEDD